MLLSAVILAIGLPAVWIDTRTHRIPNLLVLSALAGACAIQLLQSGTAGLLDGFAGALVGLVFLLPLHLAGAMGAGDVKLMAAFGALLGFRSALIAGVLTLVAGAALAVVIVAWRQRRTLVTAPDGNDAGMLATRIPYAAAIVSGVLAASLLGH